MSKTSNLFEFTPQDSGAVAKVRIDPQVRGRSPVSPWLYGKFCEHLGNNIYHGMHAQILFNATFGRWSFAASSDAINRPDGGMATECDGQKIALRAKGYHERMGLHDETLLIRDFADGAAFGWVRLGDVEQVVLSPDTGPHGQRAQRIETFGASSDKPQGIAQRLYLPLHRTRGYLFRLVGRAIGSTTVSLALSAVGADGQAGAPLAQAAVKLDVSWVTVSGRLDIPGEAKLDPSGIYEFTVTAETDANIVLERVLLYPDDHIDYADPDVIRTLREAQLPLLRWPGGNFVSGYHWRDGIGPVDARPTRPNPAWEGLEFNLFGTDEFIAFCRAVGCEPMICINGGDGTFQEAAEWVEYCNGTADTPMGRLRAQNGHEEPYGVRLWEIGNELYGRWQAGWTTAGGYVDRYRQFARAMRAVDPTIRILANGDQAGGLEMEWNRRLIDEDAAELDTITDHLLTGDTVSNDTDPAVLYQGFMGYASTLGAKYGAMCERMVQRGIRQPSIAITELQLFAHFRGQPEPRSALHPDRMPTPATISEALYLTTIINACIRMNDQVSMLTHSATVNHGGGLRKAHERVWGNPVHYAHQMGIAMAGGTPLRVSLACQAYDTDESFGQVPAHRQMPALDAMAVLSADGQTLIVMLLNRMAGGAPITLEVDPGMAVAEQAEIVTLAGKTMYDQNTLEEPERIVPRQAKLEVPNGKLSLAVPPFALVRVSMTKA